MKKILKTVKFLPFAILPLLLLGYLTPVNTAPNRTTRSDSWPAPCGGTNASLNDGYAIQFALVNNMTNKTAITCGNSFSLNGTTATPKDMRFFVSNIVVVKADNTQCSIPINADNAYQYTNALLLDFEARTLNNNCVGDAGTNFGLQGVRVPTGAKALKFTIGLQEPQNNLNGDIQQSAPMNNNGLYWSWTDGYKFTKIEFTVPSGGTDRLTELHVGSIGCTTYDEDLAPGDTGVPTCSMKFRSDITIEAPSGGSFDFGTQKVYLSMDSLFSGYNPASPPAGGCMPGSEKAACVPILQHLGLDTSGNSTGNQSAFFIQ